MVHDFGRYCARRRAHADGPADNALGPISRKICTQVKYYNYCDWSAKGQNAKSDLETKKVEIAGKPWTHEQKHDIVRRS